MFSHAAAGVNRGGSFGALCAAAVASGVLVEPLADGIEERAAVVAVHEKLPEWVPIRSP
jgi:hypothetical protein